MIENLQIVIDAFLKIGLNLGIPATVGTVAILLALRAGEKRR